MANFIFNVAMGSVAGYYQRVKSNDPANSALVAVVLATSGIETDEVLRDKATLADVLSGTTNEVTNVGYARKVLTDADLAAFAVDNTNNRVDLDLPDLAFGAISAGDGWSKLLICYDSDTTAGTDANIIPLCSYDAALTPDGSNLNLEINAAGFFRAIQL